MMRFMMLNRHVLRALAGLLLAFGGSLTPAPNPAMAATANRAASKPATVKPTQGTDWTTQVSVTPDGAHVLGNPKAAVRLVEYMSYTCPHCAHFESEGVAAMRLTMIASGKGSLEVRHILRDPIDMAVALLTNCVPAPRFFALHDAFLTQQDRWFTPALSMSQEQQKRWFDGALPVRMRAVANDLKLYDFVEARGLSHTDADRCLTNEALARRIATQTTEAQAKGVDSTPSFGLNGTVLTGTHDWATLRPQLDARL